MLTTRASAPLAIVATILLAACSNAGAPSPSTPTATPVSTPTAVPGDPGSSGGGAGGSSGNGTTGSGIVIPIPGDPDTNPLFGKATYVTPGQGLLNLHPVDVQLVRAIVNDNRSATIDLRWWSGVAPCTQLGSVDVVRDEAAKTVRITVIEGSGGGQVACIDIAQLTATQVHLDSLASGAWKISAAGGAATISLDVP